MDVKEGPLALAVDATSVYWTTPEGGVTKVPKDGGTAITIASDDYGTYASVGIAVDAKNVYWIRNSLSRMSTVMSVPLGGGTPTTLASEQNSFSAIVVDAKSVYWTAENPPVSGVLKVPLEGGTPTTLVSVRGGAHNIALDATSLYFSNVFGVMKVPLGGGEVTTLASGWDPYAIAVDATSVYWVGSPAMDSPQILMSVPLNGGTPTTLVSGPTTNGESLVMAVGGKSLYWTEVEAVIGKDDYFALMMLTPR
jgi:hypothetical protein